MITKKAMTKKTMRKLESIISDKLTLGNLLLSIRQGEELSQVLFAKRLGVSRQYLCDIEHNRRFVSPKAAAEFADILGYSAEQFVRLCLQDILDRDGIQLHVLIEAA